MDLSRQQAQAIQKVSHWFHNESRDKQVFRLFGWAGTGKTTLAHYFAESVDGPVVFAAYTGKAAYVLRQKGCPANTIHSQIYRPKDRSRKHLLELREQLSQLEHEQKLDPSPHLEHQITQLKKSVQAENSKAQTPSFDLWIESPVKYAKLILLDEVSMVDDIMGEDLLSFGVPILALGDPFQLPPVFGQGFFTHNSVPDFMLTEIHRQAKDNPIITMATQVREGRGLQLGSYGESRVIHKSKLATMEWKQADQIIVGRNTTRRASNMRMRELMGFNTEDPRCIPQLHDRLVCLRNNNELGLLNGSLWLVTYANDINYLDEQYPKMFLTIQGDELGAEQARLDDLLIHMFHLQGLDRKSIPPWELKEANEFDFGYALTCHKAQGSQWDYVMVVDEAYVFKQDRHKWLYTAITRAAKKLDVVKI